jgi:TDG/mug DNA glycosylase family protein
LAATSSDRPILTRPPATLAKRSFPPVIDRRSRVLVLGSLPGEESLRRSEYYAHPRNLLWPILAALFQAPVPERYPDRLALAARHRIALWDVVGIGERHASADATIRLHQPNAIDQLLDDYPAIRGLAFNGGTALRLFDRHFARRPSLVYLALPSTSPAHARLGFAEKLERWRVLRDLLEAG